MSHPKFQALFHMDRHTSSLDGHEAVRAEAGRLDEQKGMIWRDDRSCNAIKSVPQKHARSMIFPTDKRRQPPTGKGGTYLARKDRPGIDELDRLLQAVHTDHVQHWGEDLFPVGHVASRHSGGGKEEEGWAQEVPVRIAWGG